MPSRTSAAGTRVEVDKGAFENESFIVRLSDRARPQRNSKAKFAGSEGVFANRADRRSL